MKLEKNDRNIAAKENGLTTVAQCICEATSFMGEMNKSKCPIHKPRVGRPLEYNIEFVDKAREYLESCKDQEMPADTENGIRSRLVVKIPTKGGLARYLGVARETLYDWASKYPEFSDIMEDLGAEQEERLINNGLSGTYNQTITKVLITKHGYREGVDNTSNGNTITGNQVTFVDFHDSDSKREV